MHIIKTTTPEESHYTGGSLERAKREYSKIEDILKKSKKTFGTIIDVACGGNQIILDVPYTQYIFNDKFLSPNASIIKNLSQYDARFIEGDALDVIEKYIQDDTVIVGTALPDWLMRDCQVLADALGASYCFIWGSEIKTNLDGSNKADIPFLIRLAQTYCFESKDFYKSNTLECCRKAVKFLENKGIHCDIIKTSKGNYFNRVNDILFDFDDQYPVRAVTNNYRVVK